MNKAFEFGLIAGIQVASSGFLLLEALENHNIESWLLCIFFGLNGTLMVGVGCTSRLLSTGTVDRSAEEDGRGE